MSVLGPFPTPVNTMDTGERCPPEFPLKSRAVLGRPGKENACNRVLERRRPGFLYPDSPRMPQERSSVGFAMETRAMDRDDVAVLPDVGAFKSLWPDSWGPRLEYILYNAIAALLECENTTLLGVNRLLTDDAYRAWVIRQLKDPFIRAFWQDEYASYDARFQREAIAPIQNKLGQFLASPVIRNILGQVKNRVNIPFVMDHERPYPWRDLRMQPPPTQHSSAGLFSGVPPGRPELIRAWLKTTLAGVAHSCTPARDPATRPGKTLAW